MARPRKISTVKPLNNPASDKVHPTREKLLDATVELLGEHLPQAVTSDMVLVKSGISRGSLYHHFSDFSELLELAMVAAFTDVVDESIAGLTMALKSAKNKDDFLKILSAVTRNTQSVSLKRLRLQRARLIAFTEDNPRLATLMAGEQQRLTDAIKELFVQAQALGWFNRSFDPRSAAVLIQAYTLGKVIDDIVPNPMSEEGWNDLINLLVLKVFAA